MANPYFASPFPPPQKMPGRPAWVIPVVAAGGVLVVAVAAVVLILVARSAGGGNALPGPATELVRDGQFQFVVHGRPDCTNAPVGGRRPRGQWCTITVTVEHTGRKPRAFAVYNQVAFDAAGNRFQPDVDASKAASTDLPPSLRDLNPGVKFTARLVFDVGEAVRLTVLEVHDSSLSGGARIDLP